VTPSPVGLPRRRLGHSEIEVSELGLGTAPLGNLYAPVSDAEARATLDAALDGGITLLDTAPLYGHGLSERRVGAGLRERPRESFVLSTKVGRLLEPVPPGQQDGGLFAEIPPFRPVFDYTYDGVRRSLDASLERLGLDRIDVLLLHDVEPGTHGDAYEARMREALEGACRALAEFRAEGRVGAIGAGVNQCEACVRLAAHVDLDCFLVAGRYTLLEQGALDVLLPLCQRQGIGLIVGGPFNTGILATGPVEGATYDYAPAPPEVLERTARIGAVCRRHGASLAAAALRFPLGHPCVASVIPGARSASEVRRNRAALQRDLPADLWAELRSEGLLRPDAPTP